MHCPVIGEMETNYNLVARPWGSGYVYMHEMSSIGPCRPKCLASLLIAVPVLFLLSLRQKSELKMLLEIVSIQAPLNIPYKSQGGACCILSGF